MRALTLTIILFALACSTAFAKNQAGPQLEQPQAAAAQIDNGPVAAPEPSEKALSYHRGNIALWIFGTIWGLLIPAIFLFTGFSARIRDWARRLGRKWFFVIGIYFAIFSIINFLIDLPLSYYAGFSREHAYGLSNQTFNKWFTDSITELAIGIVTGVLFLWIPYLLLKKSPRRWWLYTGLLAVPFIIIGILVQPIWIDPLFNKFGPMKNKALEAKILSLAERAGIENSRVYEVEKSADTKALNAYVTGFAGTKRIVLWDTTIEKLDERELLFVMGHEMGHYVLGHIWKMIIFFTLLIIITLYAIHRTAGWLINKYRDRFGFSELSDVASLPLLILLFGAYLFVLTPLALSLSRYNERESDRFGLEITKNNHSAATAFVKLQTENLGVPRPHWIVKLWQASHPTLGERIDFCNQYRPWEEGQPLRYGSLFKQPK